MSEPRTPDERFYALRAECAKRDGLIRSTRGECEVYLQHPTLHQYPSPVRWLWTWWTRWVGVKWASILGAMAAFAVSVVSYGPLAALVPLSSPLSHRLERRHLQDTTVAALALATLSLSLHGHPWLSVVPFALLLCVKESAVPYVGAWLLSMWLGGTSYAACLGATAVAFGLWVAGTRYVCGPQALDVLRAGSRGHRTDYTRDHQSGMPHRLLADLVLVSPWVVALAVAHPSRELALAATILAAHALTPVRNVRTVLAADLLLRVSVGAWLASLPWLHAAPLTLALCAYDVWVARRLRVVFDPVTSALVAAVGR